MKCLDNIRDALLTVTENVGHYEAFKKTDQYIVWAEDGGYSGHGDNRSTTKVVTGTIDYFTKNEGDPNVEAIQNALDSIDIAWSMNSIQYEDKTGFLHYEWVFEVVC
ncbi:MAG TPA: hypothetical protein GX523_15335 [Desulfitobacterium dehalogenans]|uniref:Uncharacterized protein n=1 Tax=Desulfitobacterium dehalogenans TaxID=36854 RepID=A0A7C6Z607_9FIRM|nr:hypothetical protein [Desulfitobacterium dehalogenans]